MPRKTTIKVGGMQQLRIERGGRRLFSVARTCRSAPSPSLPWGVLLAIAALVTGLGVPQPASADTTGTLVISKDTRLREDHRGNVRIDADGITLDCAGHRLVGTGHADGVDGITLQQRTGVTVRDCIVAAFRVGISLVESNGNVVKGNRLEKIFRGVQLQASSDNRIVDNVAENTAAIPGARGFNSFESSSRNRFERNTASGFAERGMGFRLTDSVGSVLRDNTVSGGGSSGIELVGGSGNIIKRNNINVILSRGIGFNVTSSSDNTFQENSSVGEVGFALQGTGESGTCFDDGFAVCRVCTEHASGNVLIKNTVPHAPFAAFILDICADNNVLEKNTAKRGFGYGFSIVLAFDNTLKKNSAQDLGTGFAIALSKRNILEKNSAFANGEDGFSIVGSSDNRFEKNVACGNATQCEKLVGVCADAVLEDQNVGVSSTGNSFDDNEFCTTSGIDDSEGHEDDGARLWP